MEACVQYQGSPYRICDEQSSTGAGFSLSTSVFPANHHSTNAPYSFITRNWYNWPTAGSSTMEFSYSPFQIKKII